MLGECIIYSMLYGFSTRIDSYDLFLNYICKVNKFIMKTIVIANKENAIFEQICLMMNEIIIHTLLSLKYK